MNSLLSGQRILVVEDEMLVAWMLADLLAELGCVVVGPVARVDQALTAIGEDSVDAAVLDINLNGQTSYPVADALAARGVPFVFSTGYARDRLSKDYGDVPVLQKPLSGAELRDSLATMLGLRTPDRPPPTGEAPSAPDA